HVHGGGDAAADASGAGAADDAGAADGGGAVDDAAGAADAAGDPATIAAATNARITDPALQEGVQAALEWLQANAPEAYAAILAMRAQGIDAGVAAAMVLGLFDDPGAAEASGIPADELQRTQAALDTAGIGRAGVDPAIPAPPRAAGAAAPAVAGATAGVAALAAPAPAAAPAAAAPAAAAAHVHVHAAA
ncbi:MAG: hypothetical protein JWM98_1888, partial [Thermoleophilia bacterium]|nr:hypothetical protein [Thermoleophilia bacterium]